MLDVGTGTGILAFFAIQAGARKVYAVEASNMAKSAQKLVDGNGMEGRIIVINEMGKSNLFPFSSLPVTPSCLAT